MTVAISFSELSPRTQLIVFAVLSLAAAAGAWQVLLAPAQADLATREARLTGLQQDVARVQAIASKLPTFERDVKALEISLRETTAVLPDEKDPQDVLRNLHDLASEAALDLSSFTPKAIVTKAQYSEWPIELGLEGGYHNLGRFFDRVGAMSRLMSVADLHIKVHAKATSKNTIAASCVATTFVFKKDIAAVASTPIARANTSGGAQ